MPRIAQVAPRGILRPFASLLGHSVRAERRPTRNTYASSLPADPIISACFIAPRLASWSSPSKLSPPSYHSIVAGLLRAGPSAQSRGPPPPLAVDQRRLWIRRRPGTHDNNKTMDLQAAPSTHAGLLRVPCSNIRMQARASSYRSYVNWPVAYPPCATLDGCLSYLCSCKHGLASILIEVLPCQMQVPSQSSFSASSPSSVATIGYR